MQLREDQIQPLDLIKNQAEGGILLGAPPGFGKGFLSAWYLKDTWDNQKFPLIVCPASQIYGWKVELIKQDLPYLVWEDMVNYRRWYRGFKVGIVSFDSLRNYVMPYCTTVIFDETLKLLNYKSQRATKAYSLALKSQRVIGLNGTPMAGLKPLQIWTQSRVIHRGEILSKNPSQYWTDWKWQAQERTMAKLMVKRLLESGRLVFYTWVVNSAMVPIPVKAKPETISCLHRLKEEYMDREDELIETVPVVYLKMQQTCGFDENKLQSMVALVDSCDKLVVICKYNAEIEELYKRCRKLKKCVCIYGKFSPHMQKQIEKGMFDVVFLQTKLGVNVNCFKDFDKICFYSRPHAGEAYLYEQNYGRLTRTAGKDITIYHIYLQGTYDAETYRNLVSTQKEINNIYAKNVQSK